MKKGATIAWIVTLIIINIILLMKIEKLETKLEGDILRLETEIVKSATESIKWDSKSLKRDIVIMENMIRIHE